MASGKYASEDEPLRDVMETLQRRNEEIAAIAAGIEDMQTGRYQPLEEVGQEIRRKLGFGEKL